MSSVAPQPIDMSNPAQRLSLLASIVEGSEDAILSKTLDGVITSWNAASERMFGFSALEVIGQSISCIVPESLMDEERFIIDRIRTGERLQHFETLRKRKDMSVFDVFLTVSPILDADGKVMGASTIARDISDQKAAERKAARQANLLNQAYEAILVRDRNDCITYWNNGAARMYGWSASEAIGTVSHTLLKTEFPKSLESIMAEMRAKGFWKGELIHTARNGARVCVQTHWVLESGAGDANVLETNFDTTEQRRSLEREARAHAEIRLERRFRELLEAAPDAIIEVDRNGRIVLLNRVTESMFGFHREELIGQQLELLVPKAHRTAHAADRERFFASPTIRVMGAHMDLEGQRKDGTLFPVEISLSPIYTDFGVHVSAVIRDVSDRKKTEAAFRSLQDEYARALAAKNQELEARNQELSVASKAKSEFLASMSHELRTPLHTIVGFSELLQEQIPGSLNEQQQRFMQHIHHDAEHLLTLINEILDLSKIEAGRVRLQPEPVDIATCLHDAVATILPQAKSKHLTLAIECGPLEKIVADPLRVKQVLINLLSNAVKFTPEGGRISVEAVPVNHSLQIAVSDTGVGIHEAEHERIFEKFYQAKDAPGGTGLGLSISRHLVELHNGKIWVESRPGEGSVFRFTLPLPDQTAPAS